jgi:hypothetical protein
MKKFLSVLAVATIAAGLTASMADAKPRKSTSKNDERQGWRGE